MVQSAVFPALSTIDSGRPRPSTAGWTLVVSPPRDRPSASRQPPNLPIGPLRQPVFAGARGMLMRPGDYLRGRGIKPALDLTL
jgi:hypothetical protein